MSKGLTILGILGASVLVALGISASEPSTPINTSGTVVTPVVTEIKTTKPGSQKPVVTPPSPKAPAKAKPISSCHPNYSGCLKMNAGDYDCASGSGNGPNYTGPVEVYGSDPFDLDRDNDGLGCE